MNIRWARGATRPLTEAHAYIAADNPDAADRLVSKVEDAVEQLSAYPRSGREGRVKDTRELAVLDSPYLIVYRIRSKDTVHVLAILHGKRRWPDSF
jgi:toxin ParE1/3/4